MDGFQLDADKLNCVGEKESLWWYYYVNGVTICKLDVNECLPAEDLCQQLCTNTEGGFVCECQSGFTLDADGFSCNRKFDML